MNLVLIGSTPTTGVPSFEAVVAELERRGHVVTRFANPQDTPEPAADVVLHLSPSNDEEGLEALRAYPGYVIASADSDHRILRLATGLVVQSRRQASIISGRVRRHAEIVPPTLPHRSESKPPSAPTRDSGRVRLVSFVGPATIGRLVDISYAISMLGDDAQRVAWRIVGQPQELASVIEICSAIGVGIEVVSASSMTTELANADIVLAPASTGEDPLTNEIVLALAEGHVVLMAEDETELPVGSYLAVGSADLTANLVVAFRNVLQDSVDLAQISREAARYAETAFSTSARADAVEAIAARSLRLLHVEIDEMVPELAGWRAEQRDTPATVYADDFWFML